MSSSTIQLFMSPLEPTVIDIRDFDGISTDSETEEIIVKLLPIGSSAVEITCPLLGVNEDYILALWDPEPSYLAWERTYHDFHNSDNVSPQSSIKILVKQPHSDITVIPWWRSTTISARNPDKIFPHFPFIAQHFRDSSIDLGEIPNNSNDEENFNRTVSETYTHYETQPIVRPGEYITLQWGCYVNGKSFTSPTFNLKYDTPLFTGGWILSKIGEGIDVRFSVEIFGEVVTDIIPSDFYDYQVGDWVYLMKVDVDLKLEEEKQNKQLYGSDELSESGESSDVFQKVNNQRVENGVDPVFNNDTLAGCATLHAQDLALNGIGDSAHLGSNGSTLRERVDASGYLDDAGEEEFGMGENVVTYALDDFAEGEDLSDEVVQAWMDSPSHRANILNGVFTEAGIGKAVSSEGDVYYVQVFGFKNSNTVDGAYNGQYRIVPFNFDGPMNIDCGISFADSIGLSSSANFEEVFDMIKYEAVIDDIDYENDTANITTSEGEEKEEIPIFYYCNDLETPTIVGGSKAFTIGDQCLVEVPKGNDWNDAQIIGFPSELKFCSVDIIVIICEEITILDEAPWQTSVQTAVLWDPVTDNYPSSVLTDNEEHITGPVLVEDISNFLSTAEEIGADVFPVISNYKRSSVNGMYDTENFPIEYDEEKMKQSDEYNGVPVDIPSLPDPTYSVDREPISKGIGIQVSEKITLTFTSSTEYTISGTVSTFDNPNGTIGSDKYGVGHISYGFYYDRVGEYYIPPVSYNEQRVMFFIPSAGWSGTWQAGDTFSFNLSARGVSDRSEEYSDSVPWEIPTITPDHLGNTNQKTTHYPDEVLIQTIEDVVIDENLTKVVAHFKEIQDKVEEDVESITVISDDIANGIQASQRHDHTDFSGGTKVLISDFFTDIPAVSFGFSRNYELIYEHYSEDTYSGFVRYPDGSFDFYARTAVYEYFKTDWESIYKIDSPFLFGESFEFSIGMDSISWVIEPGANRDVDRVSDHLRKTEADVFSSYSEDTLIISQQVHVTKSVVTYHNEYPNNPSTVVTPEEDVVAKSTNIFFNFDSEDLINENPLQQERHATLEAILNTVPGYISGIKIYKRF